MYCVLSVNYQSLFYHPTNQRKIDTSIQTVNSILNNTYQSPGQGIIKSANYPDKPELILPALKELHKYPKLSCDIETFSLQIDKAGLGSIAFAWDEHNGIAFAVEHNRDTFTELVAIKYALITFFEEYTGKLTFHGGAFDIKILIYYLWMDNIDDIKGLLHGLDIMTRNIDDTMIIAYLATNNAVNNELGLKPLSQSFSGNYAQESINDITLIPTPQLLEYNLIDCLSTNWAKKRYYSQMVEDQQEKVYKEIFLSSLKALIQTELTGMCLDMDKVSEAEEGLNSFIQKQKDILDASPYINNFKRWAQHYTRQAANAKLKKKVKPYSDFPLEFNEGSGKQIGLLIQYFLGYEIADKTPTGAPATGNDSLKKLFPIIDEQTKGILNAIMEINTAQKIVGTFIKAFKEKSILHADGHYYLHGNFKLGGTVSGRISSNSPNLMNLPSGSTYGKLIKACFISPPNKLFVGADYSALENKIDALLTHDPLKVAVYAQGFDSHALASFFYFKDQMPDIVKELDGYFDTD